MSFILSSFGSVREKESWTYNLKLVWKTVDCKQNSEAETGQAAMPSTCHLASSPIFVYRFTPRFKKKKKEKENLVSAQFSFKISLSLYIWKLEILAVKCYTQEWFFFLHVCLYHCNTDLWIMQALKRHPNLGTNNCYLYKTHYLLTTCFIIHFLTSRPSQT